VAYGYRVGEVPLPDIPESDATAKFIGPIRNTRIQPRPEAVSLGCHLTNAALPRPDTHDAISAAAGTCYRFARGMPVPQANRIAIAKDHTLDWLKKNMTPLSPDTDISVETWIGSTPYAEPRKQELRELWGKFNDLFVKGATREQLVKFIKCKSHIKDEPYPEYKYPRPINSRTDLFKCVVGPWFKRIEMEIFKCPEFIKKVPMPDRPRYMMDKLFVHASKFIETDYSSFEAAFTAYVMEHIEMPMYDYLTRNIPGADLFMWCVRNVLAGDNRCDFKDFSFTVNAKRMSGEMCTSLGNGFTNFMLMQFLTKLLGSEMVGIFEGDDGVTRINGNVPTPEDFASMGFSIKLNEHTEINKASFCGMVFDPDEMMCITDPKEVLATIGWSGHKYVSSKQSTLKALLRCKAYSYGYQYQACPVISSMARAYLRLTSGISIEKLVNTQFLNQYEMEQLKEALANGRPELCQPVGIKTRQLMEDKYAFPIILQYMYEDYFDNLKTIEPIPLWFTPHESWVDYFSRYCRQVDPSDIFIGLPDFNYESPVHSKIILTREPFTTVHPQTRLSWACSQPVVYSKPYLPTISNRQLAYSRQA